MKKTLNKATKTMTPPEDLAHLFFQKGGDVLKTPKDLKKIIVPTPAVVVPSLDKVKTLFGGHPKTKVAAVLLKEEPIEYNNEIGYRVVSVGWNHIPAFLGTDGLDDDHRVEQGGFVKKQKQAKKTKTSKENPNQSLYFHAEIAALIEAIEPTEGCIAVVTGTLCPNCLVSLAAAGIKKAIIPEQALLDLKTERVSYAEEVSQAYPAIQKVFDIEVEVLKEDGKEIPYFEYVHNRCENTAFRQEFLRFKDLYERAKGLSRKKAEKIVFGNDWPVLEECEDDPRPNAMADDIYCQIMEGFKQGHIAEPLIQKGSLKNFRTALLALSLLQPIHLVSVSNPNKERIRETQQFLFNALLNTATKDPHSIERNQRFLAHRLEGQFLKSPSLRDCPCC